MSTSETSTDKYQSRCVRAQIRQVLMDVWDPIGVKDEPNAQKEYDAYIEDIYKLLIRKAPDSRIAEYLNWVAHDRMGFDAAQIADMTSTVEALKVIPLDSVD